MKRILQLLTVLAVICGLAGCEGMTKADVGTITGGALGGVIGSQFGSGGGRIAAAFAGTAIGAVIGNRMGAAMDARDRMMMSQALETAPTGQAYSWRNPDTGNSYTVVPEQTIVPPGPRRGYSRPCRRYVQTAIIGGRAQKIEGRACRVCKPSGRCVWQVA